MLFSGDISSVVYVTSVRMQSFLQEVVQESFRAKDSVQSFELIFTYSVLLYAK